MCDRCDKIDWDSTTTPPITGAQFGIAFYNLPYKVPGANRMDPNPQFRVFTEDDGLWHFTGLSASVSWLKDLELILKDARASL
jgi:hypothetical protein